MRFRRWKLLVVLFAGLASIGIVEARSLDLSKPLSLSCETSAVKLDTEPFEASKGEVVLKLELDDAAKPEGSGRWQATATENDHASSFGVLTKEFCAPNCPFNRAKDGSIQLWSPKPMALTQLDETTTLVLISLNPASLELKASFFTKKQLSGLERGDCKLLENDASETTETEQKE